jgi:hypothetical protein
VGEGFDRHFLVSERLDETMLRPRAQARRQEIGHFRQNGDRRQQRLPALPEESDDPVVPGVVRVGQGVDGAGVEEQGDDEGSRSVPVGLEIVEQEIFVGLGHVAPPTPAHGQEPQGQIVGTLPIQVVTQGLPDQLGPWSTLTPGEGAQVFVHALFEKHRRPLHTMYSSIHRSLDMRANGSHLSRFSKCLY